MFFHSHLNPSKIPLKPAVGCLYCYLFMCSDDMESKQSRIFNWDLSILVKMLMAQMKQRQTNLEQEKVQIL